MRPRPETRPQAMDALRARHADVLRRVPRPVPAASAAVAQWWWWCQRPGSSPGVAPPR